MLITAQWTQNISITFVYCWPNVEDLGPTLYKCYTQVLCLLGAEKVRWINVILMLSQRRRRCANFKTALFQRSVCLPGYIWSVIIIVQQTREIQTILFQCWANVADGELKFKQPWDNISCLLGCRIMQDICDKFSGMITKQADLSHCVIILNANAQCGIKCNWLVITFFYPTIPLNTYA